MHLRPNPSSSPKTKLVSKMCECNRGKRRIRLKKKTVRTKKKLGKFANKVGKISFGLEHLFSYKARYNFPRDGLFCVEVIPFEENQDGFDIPAHYLHMRSPFHAQ